MSPKTSPHESDDEETLRGAAAREKKNEENLWSASATIKLQQQMEDMQKRLDYQREEFLALEADRDELRAQMEEDQRQIVDNAAPRVKDNKSHIALTV